MIMFYENQQENCIMTFTVFNFTRNCPLLARALSHGKGNRVVCLDDAWRWFTQHEGFYPDRQWHLQGVWCGALSPCTNSARLKSPPCFLCSEKMRQTPCCNRPAFLSFRHMASLASCLPFDNMLFPFPHFPLAPPAFPSSYPTQLVFISSDTSSPPD